MSTVHLHLRFRLPIERPLATHELPANLRLRQCPGDILWIAYLPNARFTMIPLHDPS